MKLTGLPRCRSQLCARSSTRCRELTTPASSRSPPPAVTKWFSRNSRLSEPPRLGRHDISSGLRKAKGVSMPYRYRFRYQGAGPSAFSAKTTSRRPLSIMSPSFGHGRSGSRSGSYSRSERPARSKASCVVTASTPSWRISVTISVGLSRSHSPICRSVGSSSMAPAPHTEWHSHRPGWGGFTRCRIAVSRRRSAGEKSEVLSRSATSSGRSQRWVSSSRTRDPAPS